MVKTVFVVGIDPSVSAMFTHEGWDVVDDPNEAGYICFTGGADVSPDLYGEVNEGLSHTNPARDTREIAIFNAFKGVKRFLGICRGGQFLNVMNGGKLRQHIEGHHGYQTCWVYYGDSSIKAKLHEDHHQEILPTEDGIVFAKAIADNVVEGVWYKDTKSFCFQPHPEWGNDLTKRVFFDQLEYQFN